MTKLEEATKALARKLGEFERDAAVSELTAEEHRALVVAVLEAVREPSEEMARAGFASDAFRKQLDRLEADFEPKVVWKAMIDAALTEERAEE